MSIRVRALIKSDDGVKRVAGYRDHKRIKEGEEFTIESKKEFSARWMEYVDKPTLKD